MTVEFFTTTKIDDSCIQVRINYAKAIIYGSMFFMDFFHEICTLQA